MFKKQLSLLFIICLLQHSSGFIDIYFRLAKESLKIMRLLNETQSSADSKDGRILQQLTMINEKLDDLKISISDQFDDIRAILGPLPDEIGMPSMERDLSEFVNLINDEWDAFLALVMHDVSREEYNHFVTTNLTPIEGLLSKFRNYITPAVRKSPQNQGLFMSMARLTLHQKHVPCGHGETYHHILVRLYQIILMTEIKAHTLLTFAYANKASKDEGHTLYDTVKSSFRDQFSKYLGEFRLGLAIFHPSIIACDPKDSWHRNVDFYELEGFIQRTVYRGVSDCGLPINCPSNAGNCSMLALNEHSSCKGQLYDCAKMKESSKDTDVCVWDDGPHKIRYVHRASDILGVDTVNACPPNHLHQLWQSSGDEVFCDCQCYSQKWKFIGQYQRSRTDQNYVIVGLRFSKLENYIYIQIAEGRLESNGYISDFSWAQISRERAGWWDDIELLKTQKEMHLDDLKLLFGSILIGIRFKRVMSNGNNRIGFEIEGMKFDYETGKLDTTVQYSRRQRYLQETRELTYKAKNSITMQPLRRHVPDSDGYHYITFGESDRDADFGQSTLPLLDGVPVLTNPLSPIGGVGIFHKGFRDYAGFISLRLFPIDYQDFTTHFLQKHDLKLQSTWDNDTAY